MISRVGYNEDGMNRWPAALRLTGIGFYIATCILLGILTGLWLDNKLRTIPLFILLGALLGLGLALLGVYRMVRPLMEREDRGKRQ
jgi:F0F1-type ATP synthase assembly protein I